MHRQQTTFPQLFERCSRIQREVITLSGLTEDALTDAAHELGQSVNHWLTDREGGTHDDPYEAFRQMLQEYSWPWPETDNSHVHGLTVAQLFFAKAYAFAETALQTLAERPRKGSLGPVGYSEDDAACFAIYSAKALVHGKSLLDSPLRRLTLVAR